MKSSSRFRLSPVALVLILVFSSGCMMVGPDYKQPKEQMPAKWVEENSKGVSTQTPMEVKQWWTLFNDPVLNSLIEEAETANKDLKIAYARIREARAQRTISASALFPSVNTKELYGRNRLSSDAAPPSVPPGFLPPTPGTGGTFTNSWDLFQGGFDASWELDLFGGVRRSVEAATANVSASEEDYRDTLVTLLSEVAVNYLTVRGTQLRLDIANKNIEAQRQTLELTQVRFAAGLSSDLDVSQAKAQLATTESLVPSLETTLKQSMYQLATLLGQNPDYLVDRLSKDEPIPGIPPEVPVGIPSELLRRRPDVRRAERQLAAATAQIGVATADLFPHIDLTGNIGQASMSVGGFARSANSFWSLGPTLRWNLFNAGATRANIEVQKARTEEALQTYEKTVLTALQDVESALVAYSREQNRRGSLVTAVDSNQRAFDISSELYARGLADFLRVLDSQRSLYVTQDQLALSDQQVSSNLVALYKALGGGWETTP
jgi:NodT family efflux transporter outer membrane factor (OMF) lipoprotein